MTTAQVTKYTTRNILDRVKADIATLEKQSGSKPQTSGVFSYAYNKPGSRTGLNLETCNDMSHILNAAGFLATKNDVYTKAADAFGLAEYPVFELNGYSVEEWMNDFKRRVHFLTHGVQLAKLRATKKQLEGMLTKEDRFADILAELGYED